MNTTTPCPSCLRDDGRVLVRDDDGHDRWVTCEDCDGSGAHGECRGCEEPAPVAELHETSAWWCRSCRDRFEAVVA